LTWFTIVGTLDEALEDIRGFYRESDIPLIKYISYFVTPISRQCRRNLPIYRVARLDN